ncbi:hypothetical protein FQA47_023300 [Oryzias melastigma]|uniref:RING-CH-type domain-containing protein n=1 Tax=Oryzias melastigma TaxID=30732 RepID=A0A834F8A1_ORYME|nr:hypothetical protein FQA47_023300 [Oryzias melastigma]
MSVWLQRAETEGHQETEITAMSQNERSFEQVPSFKERKMGSEYQLLSSTVSCSSLFKEMSECFICRDGELISSNPLRNFCDCKNLLAHHVCLSTWIQRGCGCADRLQCIICKAKYQLQRRSPWRSLSVQWQTWLALITAIILMGAVPYVVHCLMTCLPQQSLTHHLQTGSRHFWFPDGAAAHQVSVKLAH